MKELRYFKPCIAVGLPHKLCSRQTNIDLLFHRLLQTENFSVHFLIRRTFRKFIESILCWFDNMPLNKWCPFGRALRSTFDAAFPFENSPTVISRFSQPCKDLFKIDLTVTWRTESTCPLNPVIVATINPDQPAGIKFCVLYVKSLNAVAKYFYKFNII